MPNALILCGALKANLGPDEHLQHAPTLPVANVPLLQHILGMLRQGGIEKVIISALHGATEVERIIQDQANPAIPIHLVVAHRQMKDANALRQMRALSDEPFLVMRGDTFIERIDLAMIFASLRATGAIAALVASPSARDAGGYGRVGISEAGHLLSLHQEDEDVPDLLINTGIYVFNPAVLDYIPTGVAFGIEQDLFPNLAAHDQKILVVETTDYYRRVENLSQYWKLNTDLASNHVAMPYRWDKRVAKESNFRLHPTAVLEGAVLLGEGCQIERDAVIQGPTVIGANVIVGRGALLDQVVVLPNTEVGKATAFRRSVIFDNRVVNADNHQLTAFIDPSILRANHRYLLRERCEQVFHSAISLVLLLLLLPLLLLVALAIRLESPGPILYTQLRVGQRRQQMETGQHPGRVFELYKFRSMYLGSDQRLPSLMLENEYHSDTFIKLKKDPRVTNVGRLIRKTSIDELPQLINVLKGDMRLVGNRPLPLYEASGFREPWQQVRFQAPAGMTGMWQVYGRSNLSIEERIILDNYYAVSRSFWVDMRILFLTIPAVLFQRGSQ